MKKPFIETSLILAALALPLLAFAQDFVPLTNLPGLEEVEGASTLPNFLNNLYRLCIGAAAVIAVLQIMRGGAYLMWNKGSITQNQRAKELIMNSIFGLLLVLSPAIVFGIINPDILDLSLDVTQLQVEDPSQFEDSEGHDTRCENYGPGELTTGFGSCREGYRIISDNCCDAHVVGGTCCARIKEEEEDTENLYFWQVLFSEPPSSIPPSMELVGDGSRANRVLANGPFETEEECTTSLSVVTLFYERDSYDLECNCTRKGEYPACQM